MVLRNPNEVKENNIDNKVTSSPHFSPLFVNTPSCGGIGAVDAYMRLTNRQLTWSFGAVIDVS